MTTPEPAQLSTGKADGDPAVAGGGCCPRCNGAGRLFVADPARAEKDDPYTCPGCVSERSFGTDAHVAAEAYWRATTQQKADQ